MSYLFYIIAALTGLLVKIVDQLEDIYKDNSNLKYAAAILYGLLIGYAISYSSFSTLWLGVIFAQLIAGKIDRHGHMVGFSIALIFAAFFGVNEFHIVDFAILFLLAYLDEVNLFEWPSDWRPALKIGTIVYSFIGRIDYFIAIMAFDVLYLITGIFLRHSRVN